MTKICQKKCQILSENIITPSYLKKTQQLQGIIGDSAKARSLHPNCQPGLDTYFLSGQQITSIAPAEALSFLTRIPEKAIFYETS